LFLGITFLHNRLFETEKSKALRQENGALKTHHATLENQLSSIETVLEDLRKQENTLDKKLFNTSSEERATRESDASAKETILLADAAGFRSIIKMLKGKSETITTQTSQLNGLFKTISVSKKDLTFLMSMPSIQPVENGDMSKLVSGFGVRINPFHKGNYYHPGADFAAARGTSVFATGNGRVMSTVKNASLQAGYGNYIEIDHGNGITTRYSHLEEVKVKPGQKVLKGTIIGTVGMSGGAVAPHVHYEILRKGIEVNPVPYMMEGLSGKQYNELQKLGSKRNQSLD
jgi:murein DD-endopeptidase MepM/ murein hydrolase activator NlpD